MANFRLHINEGLVNIAHMITQQKSYKFRIYPNAEQRHQLAVEFGCVRFVWNRCLELRSTAWKERQEKHNYVSLGRQVTVWKKTDFPWLSDATAGCLIQALIDQDKAFKNFFEKRGKYPRFKSKGDKQAVRYQLDQRHIKSTYSGGVKGRNRRAIREQSTVLSLLGGEYVL